MVDVPYEAHEMTRNKAMKRKIDRDLLSLPLQSAGLKRRLSLR